MSTPLLLEMKELHCVSKVYWLTVNIMVLDESQLMVKFIYPEVFAIMTLREYLEEGQSNIGKIYRLIEGFNLLGALGSTIKPIKRDLHKHPILVFLL